MEGPVGRVENDASIEYRKYTHSTFGHFLVPELEMPAILLFPFPVKIKQDIDSPIKAQLFMPIEIRMYL